MLVFIDDSGDPGFKLDKGSSLFFVISMVIFDDELQAEKTALAIKELKRTIGFSQEAEFRFYKTQKKFRIQFFETVKPYEFRIRSLVVDKAKIYSSELRTNKSSFYAYFIKEALKQSRGSIIDAQIRIDGSGNRIFRKNFLTYLRRELRSHGSQIMKQCKLVDSRHNPLIQMADMVAGAISRSYSDKEDAATYKARVQKHIQDEWHFQ